MTARELTDFTAAMSADQRECAQLVRSAVLQARRDILDGKYGEVADDVRAECEAFLRDHGEPSGAA